jgi:HNH endonuclease
MSDRQPGYILYSDHDWIAFHLDHSIGGVVGYCRGAGAPMKNVREGGKLFFINSRGSPHRVYFWADFVDDPLVSVDEAWALFGQELGVGSEEEWEELAARLPAIKLRGQLRVIRGSNMRALPAPVALHDVAIEEKLYAKKGWSIDEAAVHRLLALLPTQYRRPDTTLPEEVLSASTFPEGAVERILVNRYERDPRARSACIARYGTRCSICGFDFVVKYGEVMIGFIHVHHLKSLATVGPQYEVDPVRDLRPVCPNCHAVLHRRDPAYSIEEVAEFIRLQEKSPNQELQQTGHATIGSLESTAPLA